MRKLGVTSRGREWFKAQPPPVAEREQIEVSLGMIDALEAQIQLDRGQWADDRPTRSEEPTRAGFAGPRGTGSVD